MKSLFSEAARLGGHPNWAKRLSARKQEPPDWLKRTETSLFLRALYSDIDLDEFDQAWEEFTSEKAEDLKEMGEYLEEIRELGEEIYSLQLQVYVSTIHEAVWSYMDIDLTSGEGIALRLKHPSYQLGDHKVTIGGTLRPTLLKKWYEHQIQLAIEQGVDPYFWMAFSIEEYGGYRVSGKEFSFPNSNNHRLVPSPAGRAHVLFSGSSGVTLGDALHTGVYDAVKDELEELGPGADSLNWDTVSQDTLDRRSFVLLKYHQDNILKTYERTGDINYAIQSIHGYGQLPFLYEDGKYGDLVRYDKDEDTLEPTDGKSGIYGTNHPVYGFTLAQFIRELYSNSEIQEIVPSDAPLPISSLVLNL